MVAGEGGRVVDVVGGEADAAEADEARGRVHRNCVRDAVAEEVEAWRSPGGKDDIGEYERPKVTEPSVG